ncbi:hypothetical protein DSCO28_06570 [Desulfosarcina ovata subsp. sediminis]|uniref:ParB-like N-terminal domain-containing protein n=1 Tax=Desulfosarcina ovata subsp. sediminis TaxID=885957 RepID=A0A5K7ZGW8_9BACT|nr:ParB/RepB/Spo0J family partition protein [Desulfosarcina ovata]BBO80091.1 hypothetical protein DSCO28_06570 [Desulfosarcina ovata subsp. sediminis]
MDFKRSPVSLDRIDLSDDTFRITTNDDLTELALSISAIGLLQPPTVIVNQDGYIPVCGFRRIAALATLGRENVTVQALPADHPPLDTACLAISDNSSQRPLNVIEQSRAYRLLQDRTLSSDWQRVARSVGLPDSDQARKRIMPVAGMPDPLQRGILEGSIALPVALQISRFDVDSAAVLVSFFRQIHTGLNVQRELLDLMGEIALRDDISISQLLRQSGVSAIMENPSAPTPQKVRQVRQRMKILRYPERSRVEDRYHQALRSLKLDPRVQLLPPKDFEGKSYRLTLTVESRRQLEALQREIEKILKAADLLPE